MDTKVMDDRCSTEGFVLGAGAGTGAGTGAMPGGAGTGDGTGAGGGGAGDGTLGHSRTTQAGNSQYDSYAWVQTHATQQQYILGKIRESGGHLMAQSGWELLVR